jgi:hypothetical protein
LSLFYKRTFPFEPIFHGANWFALSHQCVSYILKYLEDHPEYLEFYSHTIYPDESFFHTIIGQSPFADKVQNNLTYADWSSIPAPANINADHITQFKNQVAFPCESGWHQPYFARKFGPDSQYLVDQIERELRQ